MQLIESVEDRVHKKLLSRKQAKGLLLNALHALAIHLRTDGTEAGGASREPTDLICRVAMYFARTPFFFDIVSACLGVLESVVDTVDGFQHVVDQYMSMEKNGERLRLHQCLFRMGMQNIIISQVSSKTDRTRM